MSSFQHFLANRAKLNETVAILSYFSFWKTYYKIACTCSKKFPKIPMTVVYLVS